MTSICKMVHRLRSKIDEKPIESNSKPHTSKEVFKAIDEHFKSIYEMEFEKFRELLEVMIRLGMSESQDFEILIDDFKKWKSARMALDI